MSACFDQSSGQPRVNPGKQEGGGREKNQNIGELSLRGISQPTTASPWSQTVQPKMHIHTYTHIFMNYISICIDISISILYRDRYISKLAPLQQPNWQHLRVTRRVKSRCLSIHTHAYVYIYISIHIYLSISISIFHIYIVYIDIETCTFPTASPWSQT